MTEMDEPRSPETPPALPRVAARLAAGLPLRISAFGSSTTEGIGASSPSASYPALLPAALAALTGAGPAAIVANRGMGGETAVEMALRLPGILAEDPDLLIWQTGSNDPLHGVPLARFAALTRDGLRRARVAGIDVLLIEPQHAEQLVQHPQGVCFRDAVRTLGEAAGVPVVRRWDLMQHWLASGALTETELHLGDGLHMADGGYAMLAKAVARAILEGAGWLGREDSNLRMAESKSAALPLGDAPSAPPGAE